MRKWMSILVICLSLIVITGITYAWIAPNNQAKGIDGHTDGIIFEYELSNYGSFVEEFDVTNLVFFDTNGHNDDQEEASFELEYFLDSAIAVELVITNTCKYDIELTVSQGVIDENNPYVKCIFSESKITSVDSYTSIQDIIDSNSDIQQRINTQNLTGTFNSITIYMYIIGIQPNDLATDEFLDDTYNLEIKMKAVGVE